MTVIDREWEQWVDDIDIRSFEPSTPEEKDEILQIQMDFDEERERISFEIAMARERTEQAGWPWRRTDWD